MALRVYILGDAAAYQNYALAVERAGGISCFESRPADCDCLLLPGGGDMESWRYGQKNTACRDLEPERDALELDLLADFTALGKPVLGICRGMQTINVFFGGDLVQDWPGHSAIEGVDRLHSVQNAPSFLRELYGERCVVNSCHHQIIGRLGTGLEALQRAEDGIVEAFRHKTLPVWGIQWHPERLTADCQTGTVDGWRNFEFISKFLLWSKALARINLIPAKRARWTDWRYTGRFYLRQPCKSSAC